MWIKSMVSHVFNGRSQIIIPNHSKEDGAANESMSMTFLLVCNAECGNDGPVERKPL